MFSAQSRLHQELMDFETELHLNAMSVDEFHNFLDTTNHPDVYICSRGVQKTIDSNGLSGKVKTIFDIDRLSDEWLDFQKNYSPDIEFRNKNLITMTAYVDYILKKTDNMLAVFLPVEGLLYNEILGQYKVPRRKPKYQTMDYTTTELDWVLRRFPDYSDRIIFVRYNYF